MPAHVLMIPLTTGAVALAIITMLRNRTLLLSPRDRVLAQGGRTLIANDHGGDQPPGRTP